MNPRDCLLPGSALPLATLLDALPPHARGHGAIPVETRHGAATTAKLVMAYEDSGPRAGPPVVLLHGFPYDVRQYDAVRDALATAGRRVIVPYLRGYGATRYRSADVVRSGQQAALGTDVVALLDALDIRKAVLVGYDWGGRAACIAAAIWPERVLGLVTCQGYAIQDIAKLASQPASPALAYARWYQTYFNTEIGRLGLARYTKDFCKLLWKLWSPTWRFTDAEYDRTAASFDNPDFVATVITEYRHRYANDRGDPEYDALEARLARQPRIAVPTVIVGGAADTVETPPPADPARDRFTGFYARHILEGVGHCVPAEAPQAIVAAVDILLKQASASG